MMQDHCATGQQEFALRDLRCTMRPLTDTDLSNLMHLKPKESMHLDRLQLQRCGKARYLGAFVQTRLVGHCLLSLQDKVDVHPYTSGRFCADLIDLLVLDVLRGRGIGTALIGYAEQLSKAMRLPFLGLDVEPMSPARRLYERCGFWIVGDRHVDYTSQIRDADGKVRTVEVWCVDMLKKL